jgi:hypothetical protein
MTSAGKEFLLDATAMEPPEPLQRATSILQHLERSQYLRMLHRRLPYPLLENCAQLDISYRHFASEEGGQNSGQKEHQKAQWVILFWRNDDPAMAELCGQIRQ